VLIEIYSIKTFLDCYIFQILSNFVVYLQCNTRKYRVLHEEISYIYIEEFVQALLIEECKFGGPYWSSTVPFTCS